MLRRERDGFTIVGAPEGVESFGGADLDEVVLAHVREALGPAWEELDPTDPDVLAAVADLRRAVIAAKEALSHDTEVLVPVALPGVRTQVRLGRAEFEEMIRPALAETAEAMRRALDGAGTSPADLAALVLVGGSSRIPLVPQLLSEEFGRDVTVAPDPLGVVAVGAALVAAGQAAAVGRGGPAVGAARRPPANGRRGRGRARWWPAAVQRHRSGAGRPPARPALGAAVGAAAAASPAGAPARGAAGRGPAGRPDGSAGPGTLPLAAGGAAGSPDGTEVLAVARPPKQARPFLADTPPPTTSRPRRVALFASAGALALAVLGGAVAFGIERIGAGTEAGAVTPAGSSVTDTSAPPPSVTMVPVETPAPKAPAASAAAPGHPRRGDDDERSAARHHRAAADRPGGDRGAAARPPRRRRPRRRRTAEAPATVAEDPEAGAGGGTGDGSRRRRSGTAAGTGGQ